ncbi:hypothetical protein BT96DRAFT_943681 [Gymnopus androsaceus JB14]|uniref:Secreted protein n=1 Tax=Gymnopus androsaceus JB14 TaxID=1447944 RepID=A0A6A4H7M1_9AGAR|nr:hypothetical protein BT96DRAFT_943681 [Gymnopus androsaceus JB14]
MPSGDTKWWVAKATTLVAISTSCISAIPVEDSAQITCAVCPSTIFYAGLTRRLTSSKEAISPTLGSTDQCNYDASGISISPYCLYRACVIVATVSKLATNILLQNPDGELLLSNAGGACPTFATLVSRATC